jgi:hypothetical protein
METLISCFVTTPTYVEWSLHEMNVCMDCCQVITSIYMFLLLYILSCIQGI